MENYQTVEEYIKSRPSFYDIKLARKNFFKWAFGFWGFFVALGAAESVLLEEEDDRIFAVWYIIIIIFYNVFKYFYYGLNKRPSTFIFEAITTLPPDEAFAEIDNLFTREAMFYDYNHEPLMKAKELRAACFTGENHTYDDSGREAYFQEVQEQFKKAGLRLSKETYDNLKKTGVGVIYGAPMPTTNDDGSPFDEDQYWIDFDDSMGYICSGHSYDHGFFDDFDD